MSYKVGDHVYYIRNYTLPGGSKIRVWRGEIIEINAPEHTGEISYHVTILEVFVETFRAWIEQPDPVAVYIPWFRLEPVSPLLQLAEQAE